MVGCFMLFLLANSEPLLFFAFLLILVTYLSAWLLARFPSAFPASKLASGQVVQRKPTRLSKTNRKGKNSPFGTKPAVSGPVLELSFLLQKLDLTWIFLHGCKP